MDDSELLNKYDPLIRRAASWFVYGQLCSRISYEDLLQEGYVALIRLARCGKADNPHMVSRVVRNALLNYMWANSSPLHVTKHGMAAKKQKAEQYPKARQKVMMALQPAVPLHKMLDEDREHEMLDAVYLMDDTAMFIAQFMDSLTQREDMVCQELLQGNSQKEISRKTGLSVKAVRVTCGHLRTRLKQAWEDRVSV